LPGNLPEELTLALRSKGIHQLYSHPKPDMPLPGARSGDRYSDRFGQVAVPHLAVTASATQELAKTLYLFPPQALA
jgi:hypothetical protein